MALARRGAAARADLQLQIEVLPDEQRRVRLLAQGELGLGLQRALERAAAPC
jgi:hypothetical protein